MRRNKILAITKHVFKINLQKQTQMVSEIREKNVNYLITQLLFSETL